MNAQDWIERLRLEPHPEGGFFRETWRDPDPPGGRGCGTAIYFLLRAGERSTWHRVDADEIWHHYAGGAVRLEVTPEAGPLASVVLGTDLEARQQPQAIVPAHHWQAATSLAREAGGFSLVGCTVSPAFRFDGFELAPAGFAPGAGDGS